MATLQTMPSNYELAAVRFGFDPSHDSTLKNYKEKNIGDLKTFKSSKMAASREQIELVHGALREIQGVKGDLLNLQALETHLPSHMRKDFLQLPHHGSLLGHLAALNANFAPVLDYLICFKSEVGLCLQRMVESYNMLILAQFKGYSQTENIKQKEFEERARELEQKVADVATQKAKQDFNDHAISELVLSKDKAIEDLRGQLEALQKKQDELQEWIERGKLHLDQPEERAKAQRE